MKKALCALIGLALVASGAAQSNADLIFKETMGAGTTGPVAVSANTFANTNLTFSGNIDLRTTTASSGYAGASGGLNAFFSSSGTGGTKTFTISGIDTTGYEASSFVLSFGAKKSTNAANLTELKVGFSVDGVSYTDITFPGVATGTGTTAPYYLIEISNLTLPTVSSLSLQFSKAVGNPEIRLDDISLSGTVSAVPEPTSMVLASIAGVTGGFGAWRRRKAKKAVEA